MSNVSLYIDFLNDLRRDGQIDEQVVNAYVMRACFEAMTLDKIEKVLADAEAYQIDEWNAQDALKAENRQRAQAARDRKLQHEVVSTQGVPA